MNNQYHKKKLSHRILDIILLAVCVMFVGAGVFSVQSFMESSNYTYDAQSFYWRLEDEDYVQMVEMYHVNEAAGVEPDEELTMYYGVARYFEAASFYKMYKEADEQEKAAAHQLVMQEAKEQMGALGMVSDQICEKLEIK